MFFQQFIMYIMSHTDASLVTFTIIIEAAMDEVKRVEWQTACTTFRMHVM